MNVKIGLALIIGLSLLVLIKEGQIDSGLLAQITKNDKSTAPKNNARPIFKGNTDAEQLSIQASGDHLSLAIVNQSIQEAAKAIAQQAKLNIILDKDVPNSNIALRFSNLPIQQGLQRLFENYDTFFFYSNSKGTVAELASIWVFPKGKGENLKPFPANVISTNSPVAITTNNAGSKPSHAVLDDYVQTEDMTEILDSNLLLDKARNDKKPANRLQALVRLTALGKDDSVDVDLALETALIDEDPNVRGYAVQALVNRQGEGATKYLRQALQDRDLSVQIAAVENVIPEGEGIAVLEEASFSPNELIRAIAVDRLKSVPPK
jgi:hypothetical protein